jgi:hypothetical protein
MLGNLNLYGLLLGAIAFLNIGIFHPIVAKTEYYWGKKVWWIFFVLGLFCSILSLYVENTIGTLVLGVTGFSLFWSTHEIFKQHKRVLHGQAKRNPNRMYTNGIVLIVILFSSGFNFTGLIIGFSTFCIIAFSRWLCIKAEYWFSKKFWVVFCLIGIVSMVGSLLTKNLVISSILGINGFTFFWGIGEIIEQEERVKKGWFPKRCK